MIRSPLLLSICAFGLGLTLCIVTAGLLALWMERRSVDAVSTALAEGGLTWATVSADGLEVFLDGTAPNEAAAFRASQRAAAQVDADRIISRIEIARRDALRPPRFPEALAIPAGPRAADPRRRAAEAAEDPAVHGDDLLEQIALEETGDLGGGDGGSLLVRPLLVVRFGIGIILLLAIRLGRALLALVVAKLHDGVGRPLQVLEHRAVVTERAPERLLLGLFVVTLQRLSRRGRFGAGAEQLRRFALSLSLRVPRVRPERGQRREHVATPAP